MKFKDQKRYLTITKAEVGEYIKCPMAAINKYIDEVRLVEDVNYLLMKFMKAKKNLQA